MWVRKTCAASCLGVDGGSTRAQAVLPCAYCANRCQGTGTQPLNGRVLPLLHMSFGKGVVLQWCGSRPTRDLKQNVLPGCWHPGPLSEAQLQYGLLLYFCRKYDDAWIELALYLERYGPKASANGQAGKREGGAGARPGLGLEQQQGEQGSAQAAFADCSAADSNGVAERGMQAAPEAAGRAGGSGSLEDAAGQSGQSSGNTVTSEQAARVQMLIEKLRLLLDFAPAPVNN